jgi:hypothetical protein
MVTNIVLVASYKFEEQGSLYEMTNNMLISPKKIGGPFKLFSPYRLRKNHMHSTNKKIELQNPCYLNQLT